MATIVGARSGLFHKQVRGGLPAILDVSRFSGNVFFVDANAAQGGGTAGFGSHPDQAFSTLDFAIGQCTANQGDVIFVLPGHTENVIAAAGIDLDVAGISVIGLGSGAARPTFTFTTATTADIDIDAASILLENVILDMTGIDAIAAGLDVNAADFTLRGCRVLLSDSAGQATLAVLGDAAADRLTIEDCLLIGSATAGPASAIRLNGSEEARIARCHIMGDFSAACIDMVTAAPKNCLIEENDLENYNAVDVCIEGYAAATGSVRWNTCRVATNAQITYINTPGSLQLYENYGVNNDGETGQLVGTPSS